MSEKRYLAANSGRFFIVEDCRQFCFTFYSELVMKGFITWGVRVMIVAVRHDVGAPSGTACPFCGAVPSMRHYVAQCRMAPLLRVFFHSRLLLAL